ncbi:RING-15 protein [Purpureocillium lilacinum]|uniref:RING-15 protein n=1 Tax=Purpureocillium lilacinum TaxID=33203 RepID=A0A179GDM1_PURLI|nr:RING-15 protein [Purpureocillium lilacinum]
MPRKGQASRKQHKNQRRPSGGLRANTVLDDYDHMAEMRAVRDPSSRRGQTSITHLLNYTAPRSYQDHGHHHHPRSFRRNPTWGPGSGYHAADKARYVHANYRFVVSPDGVYKTHAADADLYLEWTNILQVIASPESQSASCPICLSEPVAPRMAKCGHIFCLSCLIRFMNSSSDDDSKSGKGARWKRCPICEDTIYLHEVRPVRFYAGQETPLPNVGDDVVLRLMARKANSTLALPWEGGAEVLNAGDDVPWHFAANVLDYARIMKGTTEYMHGQYDEEISALTQQEREDELLFGQDNEWTQKAIKAVTQAKERTEGLANPEAATSIPGPKPSKQPGEADFYFYSSPPHLYLSPLDIRILKTKYGAFSNFPSTLLPRIEHISTGHVVDDAMRKRAKYLGHLPRGCVVSFLECDWTDIVPAETLASFNGEIERRRKRNRDKAAQEERERQQAERIEAADLRRTLGTPRMMEPMEEDVQKLDISEFQPLSVHSGTTPPDPRPGFETLASMSTSPSTQRTVWGTRALAASPELEPTRPNVDDGWLKDEELLGTAELAMQLEAIDAVEHATAGGEASVAGGGGGKKGKKKKQKITLMSTGGRRGN